MLLAVSGPEPVTLVVIRRARFADLPSDVVADHA